MPVFHIASLIPEKENLDVFINGKKLSEYTDIFESNTGMVHIKVVHRKLLSHEDKIGRELMRRHVRGRDDECKYGSVMPPYFCVTEAYIIPEEDSIDLTIELKKQQISITALGAMLTSYKSEMNITKRGFIRGLLCNLATILFAPFLSAFILFGAGYDNDGFDLELIIGAVIASVVFFALVVSSLVYLVKSIKIYSKKKSEQIE